MAEALFRRAAANRHQGRSAGTAPGAHVHPVVVTAMEELGIDLSDHVPRRLRYVDAEWADVVVTMGCGDACPAVAGTRYLDWELSDPSGRPLEEVRARDEIERRTLALARELDS
ncbi:MAG: heat-shock protein HtpX [Candidatus Rokuibacteriota bacterium]|nr:MAG: heat-shock protein HtpX [Candidatus Rokubacteria bacterium]